MNVDILLSGKLRERFLKLPRALQRIVLEDLETAAKNRMSVMERVKREK
jgi:hypothetical protein